MPPERILVPLDLTAPGEAKLPAAREYARAFGAALLLLHVLPVRPVAALAERLPRRRDDADGEVAREKAVGLLVIGSDARGPLTQRFLGSIAGSIVAGAPCPVLLVRPELAAPTPPQAVRSFADDAERAGLLAPRGLGQRTIALARIIGSVGKAANLGTTFRPARPTNAEQQRYDRVVQAGSSGGGWPPIDVYKLGYGYYVLDGRRRVAAAAELGQTEIEANVTEFVPADDAQAQRLFATRRAFERRTGLTRVGAAVPETYRRLEGAIGEFAAAHGLDDPREAAERWRRAIFRPLVARIRALDLNRHFPGDRSADILARVADYRQAVTAREGRAPDWPEALERFAADPRGAARGAWSVERGAKSEEREGAEGDRDAESRDAE